MNVVFCFAGLLFCTCAERSVTRSIASERERKREEKLHLATAAAVSLLLLSSPLSYYNSCYFWYVYDVLFLNSLALGLLVAIACSCHGRNLPLRTTLSSCNSSVQTLLWLKGGGGVLYRIIPVLVLVSQFLSKEEMTLGLPSTARTFPTCSLSHSYQEQRMFFSFLLFSLCSLFRIPWLLSSSSLVYIFSSSSPVKKLKRRLGLTLLLPSSASSLLALRALEEDISSESTVYVQSKTSSFTRHTPTLSLSLSSIRPYPSIHLSPMYISMYLVRYIYIYSWRWLWEERVM